MFIRLYVMWYILVEYRRNDKGKYSGNMRYEKENEMRNRRKEKENENGNRRNENENESRNVGKYLPSYTDFLII